MKSIYYLAMSLDGFIADSSGGVDFLDTLKIDHDAGGYDEFFAGIDGLLMGRATYDFVFDYGSWPYGNLPTWICSARPLEVLPGCHRQPATATGAAFDEAQLLGVQNLWVVGGGKLAGSLINQGLLTHIQVTVMPVLLGQGIPLFDHLHGQVGLEQVSGRSAGSFTEIVYKVTA